MRRGEGDVVGAHGAAAELAGIVGRVDPDGLAVAGEDLACAGGEVKSRRGDESGFHMSGISGAQSIADGDRAVATGAHVAIRLAAPRAVADQHNE